MDIINMNIQPFPKHIIFCTHDYLICMLYCDCCAYAFC